MGKTLEQLSNDTFNYLHENQGVSEFDMSINDISRETIEAMKRENGVCFLGKINLYGKERESEYKLTEYTGQLICNFEYEFCLPCNDSELEKMINNRDKVEYEGTTKDYGRVIAITNRIHAVGGRNLFWS